MAVTTTLVPQNGGSPEQRRRQQVTRNKNVEWINAPGAWTFITALIILGWLLACLFVDSGLAWTFVHLGHGVITYYLLHWNKGSPVQMDQVAPRASPLSQQVLSSRIAHAGLSEVISSHVLHCNKGSHVKMNQVSPADALSQSQQLLKDLCILSWAICNLQAVIFLNITRRPCRGTSSACIISIMLSCRPLKTHSVASLLKGMRLFNLCKRHLSLCQHTKAMPPGMEEREREGGREISYLFHLPGADTVSCTDRRQHGPCLSNCSAR